MSIEFWGRLTSCTLCHLSLESYQHLFMDYPVQLLSLVFNTQQMQSHQQVARQLSPQQSRCNSFIILRPKQERKHYHCQTLLSLLQVAYMEREKLEGIWQKSHFHGSTLQRAFWLRFEKKAIYISLICQLNMRQLGPCGLSPAPFLPHLVRCPALIQMVPLLRTSS